MRRLSLLLFSLVGCAAPFQAMPPTGDEVTIFIPGYEGSLLSTATDPPHTAWVTPGQGICGGKETLALPFEGERNVPMFGPLHSDGPISRITIIPLIFEGDIYGSWMEYGTEKLPGFIPVGYDWRQDIRETAAHLGAVIDRLAAQRGGQLKVNLIGHSMGGLIALYYLRYGSDVTAKEVTWSGARYVNRVVFVGTPFRGAPGIFKDFMVGTPSGLNHSLLSKEAVFTFPAAYQLMSATDDYFRDAQDHPVSIAASDPAVWCEKGWSVFADKALCADPAYQQYLSRMLTTHRETALALGEVTAPPPPTLKAMAIIGHKRETTGAERIIDGKVDVEHPIIVDGDGTVPASSALPTRPLDYEHVDTGALHVALLNDGAVRKAIARFLGR